MDPELTGIVIEPGNFLLVYCDQVGTILSKRSGSPLFSRLTTTANRISGVQQIPQEATHIACRLRPHYITAVTAHEPCSVWLQGVASVSCLLPTGRKVFQLMRRPGGTPIQFFALKDYQINFCVAPKCNQESVKCNAGDLEILGEKLGSYGKRLDSCCGIVIKYVSGGRVTISGNPSIIGIMKFPFETRFMAMLDWIDYRCRNNRPQRILVYGIRNSGKTSFCRYLLNKIMRNGRRPVNVDLSLSNLATIPGALSFFLESEINFPFYRERRELMFGYKTPDENLPLYYLLVEKLGSLLNEWKIDAASPVVIDTHSFPTLESLYFMINRLNVTTVILLGMPPGYMSGDATPNTQINPEIEVLEYPNLNAFSIGRIPLECDLAHRYRDWRLHNMFRNHVFVEYENVHIYRVSHNVEDQNNFDPRTISLSDIEIHRLPEENLTEIEDKVCAVSSAQTPDVSAALAEVKYFVLFRGILPMGRHRVFGGKLEFMSPNNLDLRGAILIVGQTIPREPAACRDCPHFACGI